MKKIGLSKGYEALVDDGDYAYLNQWKWHASVETYKGEFRRVYAQRSSGHIMHRVLLGISDRSIEVDHKNRNGIDNRRCNLRITNRSGNAKNSRVQRNTASGLKGVHPSKGAWVAQIKVNRQSKYLGRFPTKEEAFEAYCKAARELHGEFAGIL